MKLLKILVFPISILYGCIVFLRNKLYNNHLISSRSFDVPVICVGNLSMGGTGKTPHIEYVIRLLNEFKIATLSRGYGRSTNQFLLAEDNSKVEDIGDEPMQFKHKFKNIIVAVDAKRVNGINKLMEKFPFLNVVLLDDAFQHRAVKPGLSLLLTDYNKLYCNDFMLPTGTLREFRSGAKRADIIIITKCEDELSNDERNKIVSELKTLAHQQIYFSKIKYGNLMQMDNHFYLKNTEILNSETSVVLLTGIANPKPLENYLKDKSRNIVSAKYADHHNFSEKDIEDILDLFNKIESQHKIILTTEKDFMRLISSPHIHLLNAVPLFYLPIEIEFSDNDKTQFDNQILNYVRRN